MAEQSTTPRLPRSDEVTEGIRVEVDAEFQPEFSQPEAGNWVFGYQVRITNQGSEAARLFSRHWLIVDAEGESEEVRGPGVVGETPELAPGESFQYASHCPLATPWGTMEGSYLFRRDDGRSFEVAIGRFYLVAPEARRV